MNRTRTLIYYILTFLFFFTLFYINDIVELFSIGISGGQKSTINETNTESIIIKSDNVERNNVVLNDIISKNNINHFPSNKETALISLRDDKEFQESIARMEELVEYSRSHNVEQVNIEPVIYIGRNNEEHNPPFYSYFDDGLDLKLKYIPSLHIDENSHITVSNESSIDVNESPVNINEPSIDINEASVNINEASININESSVNVDNEDTESDKTEISDTQYVLDWNDDEVYPYSDSDSESNTEHLPSQEYTSINANTNQTDFDKSLKAFLDRTDKEIDKSNVPALKSSYTNEELGLGNRNIPRSNYNPYGSRKSFYFTPSNRLATYQQMPLSSSMRSETNYASSYLGSLNDPDINRIIGINPDNTINTNEVDKEIAKDIGKEVDKKK